MSEPIKIPHHEREYMDYMEGLLKDYILELHKDGWSDRKIAEHINEGWEGQRFSREWEAADVQRVLN